METGRKLDFALAGGLLSLVLVAAAAMLTTDKLVRDSEWVTHTHDVRAGLAFLDAQLREAKSDVRSYVITGDTLYVQRYRASVDSAEAVVASLQRETSDNDLQQERLRALRVLLAERLISFDRTVALRRNSGSRLTTDGTFATQLASQLAAGESLSARIGSSIAAMQNSEAALLSVRTAARQQTKVALLILISAFTIVAACIAWLARRSLRRDLEARSRIERSLRESETKFAGIVAIAADAIITIDAQQNIVLFNDGAEQIFGYERSQVIGKPIDILLPSRLTAAHHGHIAAFARAEETARRMGQRRQVLGRRANGDEFPADASISKLSTSEGLLFTVVLRDVTEQKRLERHEHLLAESGAALVGTIEYDVLLRTIAELPVPALGEWCLLDLNEAPSDVVSIRRTGSVHPDPGKDLVLRTLEARGLDEDSPSRVLDVLRTRKAELLPDVDDSWLEAHGSHEELTAMRTLGVRSLIIVPLITRQQVLGAMTIGVGDPHRRLDSFDLTLAQALADRASLAIANAQLYEAARHASAIRDEVLGVVSHDLRNPLSAASMCARSLVDIPQMDEAERSKVAQSILDAVDWMHRLIEDLLDAASIDAGGLSIRSELQSAVHIVEGAVGMLSARAAAESVTLGAEVDALTPFVEADGERVMQVLSNLIGNALKYTPAGGTVTVGVAPRGGEVLFWVRDTGAGIAAENLEHVFDRFWHLRGTSRSRGTGLGLAIARGIVTAHGGRIWVESTVGVGSTFSFTLPAGTAPQGMRLPGVDERWSTLGRSPASPR